MCYDQLMKKYILEITVFISGAVVMILELTGSRVVAPYLGTSLFVWTSLIGIILGCLSLGYWLGGKIADKNATYKKYSLILFFAGLLIAITAFSKETILEFIQTYIPGLRLGSILAAILLFAPASIFLGMVSPYAVKLKMHSVEKSGSTVGTLYAISTIGSIVGTFLAGFVLIAYFGNGKLLIIISILMIFASALSYLQSLFKSKIIIIIALIGYFGMVSFQQKSAEAEGLIDIDTNYNRVQIYESTFNGQQALILNLNKSFSSAMYTNDKDLVFEYTKYYRLARHFSPNIESALMIGGGAYSYPKDFLNQYPSATIDVVEIDPQVTEIAKKYFNLEDDPRLTSYNEDGRTFLNKNIKKYDAIFMDAFNAYSIPHQLTSIEAIQKMADGLNENGVILVNLISSLEGETSEFLRAEYRTFKQIFPYVYVLGVNQPESGSSIQNLMLIATNNEAVFTSHEADLNEYLKHIWTKEIPQNLPILTDDFAPVDQYIMKLL